MSSYRYKNFVDSCRLGVIVLFSAYCCSDCTLHVVHFRTTMSMSTACTYTLISSLIITGGLKVYDYDVCLN